MDLEPFAEGIALTLDGAVVARAVAGAELDVAAEREAIAAVLAAALRPNPPLPSGWEAGVPEGLG
ncbi:MAG: hypothetical protein ACRENV_02045 [Candidatus Dormibacteria bacterium]